MVTYWCIHINTRWQTTPSSAEVANGLQLYVRHLCACIGMSWGDIYLYIHINTHTHKHKHNGLNHIKLTCTNNFVDRSRRFEGTFSLPLQGKPRQQVPAKYQCLFTETHGVTLFIATIVKIWNLTFRLITYSRKVTFRHNGHYFLLLI
jgi:hypothetical protein